MSNNYEITIISDTDCKDCKRMYNLITDILSEMRLDSRVKVVKIDSDAENAVDIAIQKKIYDLPGCSIGDISIYGKDFTSKDIREAIEKLIQ